MPLVSGSSLGPYEIVSAIGAGGMGEVYRARDTRLGRDVALKILTESFARDPDRLRRFEIEARAVAGLSHPNIVSLYDIGQHNGAPFLVSELLEGESLRAILDHGPLPQRKTIEYGVQIAQGLAAAHDKGIIHRDLKPENIFVCKDGRVKILDFGLAKLIQPGSDSTEATVTTSHTAAGVVLGTASYMAPEQVRGLTADARTDIFAFGAVLYEMLSGARAFRRDTPAESMTAVLKEDPPELVHPGRTVSPALDRIIRRCLEKNPEQRFQSARDLSFALSALSGSESVSAHAVAAPPKKFPYAYGIAAAAALALVVGLTWMLARRPAATTPMQFAISTPQEINVGHLTLSRDGSKLAFVSPDDATGLPMVYVQHVGSPKVTMLPGTQGASYPFWSSDSQYIGYFTSNKLMKVAANGGTPQVLINVTGGRGGTWNQDDVIVYAPAPNSALWRINGDGTGAAPVTQKFFNSVGLPASHRFPVFLPDGKHFLYWSGNFANAKDDRFSGIYLGDLSASEQKLVLLGHSSFDFDSSNLYYAEQNHQLVSVPFDPSSAKIMGSPKVIADAVGFYASTYWAAFTVADNGTVIYNTSSGPSFSQITWMDRSGKILKTIGDPSIIANPTLSPDGSRFSVDLNDTKAGNVDIWIENSDGSGSTRFTFAPQEDVAAVWSRDGKTLVYRSVPTQGVVLYRKAVSGLLPEQSIWSSRAGEDDLVPTSWSPDGTQILATLNNASGTQLLLIPADGKPAEKFLASTANQSSGQFSPDGKYVVYASDESGSYEIYVTSFPSAVGKWQISRGGGIEPRWRPDGKEIYYIGPGGKLMAASINDANGFSSGTPEPLFSIRTRAPISSTDLFSYDVTRDGQRFLVNRYIKPEHIAPLNILLRVANQK